MNYRVLNLGAGVQSTTIYLMMIDGQLPTVDVAIFADTGDEPRAVYDHLDFLKKMNGPPIVTVSRGNLGDNLIRGVNADGRRFISIPSFLSEDGTTKTGIGKRQCTYDFKVEPIEKEIRRLLGVAPGERIPKETIITQIMGLSFDEPKRVARVKDRFRGRRNWLCEFPLFDEFMTRQDCTVWLKNRLPNIHVPRSACVFCPFKNDAEWVKLKTEDPKGWERAVEIDHAIRDKTSVCTRDMNSTQYLHVSCRPLELVELNPSAPDPQSRFNWSQMDCEGMCGV